MDTSKGFASNFVNFIEVMQVCCVVVFTTVAITLWVEWLEHFAIFGLADINAAIWRIKCAVASLAGRGDTVKSVAAVHSADEEVAWLGAHAK